MKPNQRLQFPKLLSAVVNDPDLNDVVFNDLHATILGSVSLLPGSIEGGGSRVMRQVL